MRFARSAWDGVGLGLVIGVASVVAGSGCFPDAPAAKNDTADGTDTAGDTVPVDTTVSDTAVIDGVDTVERDTVDTSPGDTVDPADVADTDAADGEVVSQACESDGECASLTAAPCVVGRCVERVCRAVNLSVACDDGDPCTTADKCAAGTCKGRAFNADEAKNWFLQIGGDGEDAAFGVAAHPSGDALVVGAFHGTVSVGGQTLVADGDKSDAFFLRVTPTGVVTRFVRFGDARADVGVFVAADPITGETAIAWNTLSLDSQAISTTVAWLNDNGTTRDDVTFPGKIVGLHSMSNGDLAGLLSFQGVVSLPLKEGGALLLESAPNTVAVFRLARGGFHWARMATAQAPASGIQVRVVGPRIFAALELGATTTIGGHELSAGPQTVEFDALGGFASAEKLSLRETRAIQGLAALTFPDLDESLGCGGNVRLIDGASGPKCEVTMRCDMAASTPNGAFGVGYPDPSGGMVVVGQQIGGYDFGNNISGPPGRSAVVVRYDERCQAMGLSEDRLTESDDAPSSLRFGVADVAGMFSRFAVLEGGTITFASFAKESRSLGREFEGATLVVRGSSDGLVGALSAATYYGCVATQ